jgi:hypothetical protein
VVKWRNEYRVYVLKNEMLSVCQYDEGCDEEMIDLKVVNDAIKLLKNSSDNKISYAFDWGLLSTGETALVESNDAWSIGAYKGISYEDYFCFLKYRWKEIIKDVRKET